MIGPSYSHFPFNDTSWRLLSVPHNTIFSSLASLPSSPDHPVLTHSQ
jgi:hypothetical protein